MSVFKCRMQVLQAITKDQGTINLVYTLDKIQYIQGQDQFFFMERSSSQTKINDLTWRNVGRITSAMIL